MKTNNRIIILTSLLLVTCYFLQVTQIKAQSAFGLSAIPPRLEVEVKPGESVTREIKVRNESKVEKVITVQTKDFIVANNDGNPTQIETTEEENRWAASTWLQVSQRQVVLKPLETKSLMLTVIVPDNALPGGHYAMVLHTPDDDVTLSETGASILANVGTLVYVTVPGDITQNARVDQFSAPDFQEYGPVNFKSIISNFSDIHIKPQGIIKVTNWLGGNTANLTLEDTNIFPYTSRTFENVLDKKFLFGRYKAQLQAAYGTSGGALLATSYFWVIPWKLLILILLGTSLLGSLIYLIRKQRNSAPAQSRQIDRLEKELEDLKNKYKDRK